MLAEKIINHARHETAHPRRRLLGKSAFAQRQAAAAGLHVIYLATAQAGDAEMNERIAHHRADRPADWGLVEEPLALASALQTHAAPDRCLLVDCLTLWLSNLLAAGDDRLDAETRALLNTLPSLPGQVLLVSNEVGQGIVPINPFGPPLPRRSRPIASGGRPPLWPRHPRGGRPASPPQGLSRMSHPWFDDPIPGPDAATLAAAHERRRRNQPSRPARWVDWNRSARPWPQCRAPNSRGWIRSGSACSPPTTASSPKAYRPSAGRHRRNGA